MERIKYKSALRVCDEGEDCPQGRYMDIAREKSIRYSSDNDYEY